MPTRISGSNPLHQRFKITLNDQTRISGIKDTTNISGWVWINLGFFNKPECPPDMYQLDLANKHYQTHIIQFLPPLVLNYHLTNQEFRNPRSYDRYSNTIWYGSTYTQQTCYAETRCALNTATVYLPVSRAPPSITRMCLGVLQIAIPSVDKWLVLPGSSGRHLRRLCAHCNQELFYSAYRSHRALYYLESERVWISDSQLSTEYSIQRGKRNDGIIPGPREPKNTSIPFLDPLSVNS